MQFLRLFFAEYTVFVMSFCTYFVMVIVLLSSVFELSVYFLHLDFMYYFRAIVVFPLQVQFVYMIILHFEFFQFCYLVSVYGHSNQYCISCFSLSMPSLYSLLSLSLCVRCSCVMLLPVFLQSWLLVPCILFYFPLSRQFDSVHLCLVSPAVFPLLQFSFGFVMSLWCLFVPCLSPTCHPASRL